MSDWVQQFINSLGHAGIGILMLLENIFPPIPSELIMPLAGFYAARGEMTFWLVVLVGSIGSLAGTTAWYIIGRRVGERRLRDWVDRNGRWLALCTEDIDRAQDWFHRHGHAAVFLGRMVPGLRTFISLPAGLSNMPLAPFLMYSALGTAVWTAILAFAGRLLASNYTQVEKFIGPVSSMILGGMVAVYLWRVLRQWRKPAEDQC